MQRTAIDFPKPRSRIVYFLLPNYLSGYGPSRKTALFNSGRLLPQSHWALATRRPSGNVAFMLPMRGVGAVLNVSITMLTSSAAWMARNLGTRTVSCATGAVIFPCSGVHRLHGRAAPASERGRISCPTGGGSGRTDHHGEDDDAGDRAHQRTRSGAKPSS